MGRNPETLAREEQGSSSGGSRRQDQAAMRSEKDPHQSCHGQKRAGWREATSQGQKQTGREEKSWVLRKLRREVNAGRRREGVIKRGRKGRDTRRE